MADLRSRELNKRTDLPIGTRRCAPDRLAALASGRVDAGGTLLVLARTLSVKRHLWMQPAEAHHEGPMILRGHDG